MHFLHFNLHFITLLFAFFYTCNCIRNMNYVEKGIISRKIIVDQRGQGDFTSVQKAIDSVPPNNNLWIHIYVKAGFYNEKVIIPQDKPFIILQGESRRITVIQWNEAGNSMLSATFILKADNFMAIDISFRNTYNLVIPRDPNGNQILWAPAATITADKASFYGCGFAGVQDTLTDIHGRHYFNTCYIEGAIDFIWGAGQSVYEKCVINATTGILNGTTGFITAQGRENLHDTNGYVFLGCDIYATGPVYLGRAYRECSRVIFKRTNMPPSIVPQGWQPWKYSGHEDKITYSEISCTGPGSDTSQRVKWEKTLPPNELSQLVNVNRFINEDGWIEAQPSIS